MDGIDNLNCSLGYEITGLEKHDLIRDVKEIVSLLMSGSAKISRKFDRSVSLISNLIRRNEINSGRGQTENEFYDRLESIRSGIELGINETPDELKLNISEFLPKWQDLLDCLEKMSFELKALYKKLNYLNIDIAKGQDYDHNINVDREPLPTRINGVRLSPENFITLLRYYPVPYGENRKSEIRSIRTLILAHYENLTANKFLSELKQLPLDSDIEPLIRNSTLRVKNTTKILLNAANEFCNYHDGHGLFIQEYLDSLESPSDPQHTSPEYMKEFSKIIIDYRNAQMTDLHQIKVEEEFKRYTTTLEDSVKKLVTGIGNLVIDNEFNNIEENYGEKRKKDRKKKK